MVKCDFHTHTVRSDGLFTPSQVVDMAIEKGLGAVAISDHDTVKGVREAVEYAKDKNIKVLPAIEISTFASCEIHILGYNIEYDSPEFLQVIENVKSMRRSRNERILEKLKEYGINLNRENLDNNHKNIGRMHIARQMVAEGYVKDVNEAFDNYLGAKGVCHIDAVRLKPFEAVKLIKRYGGVPVLAHPQRYYMENVLENLIEGLLKYGLEGIEVYYPKHNKEQREYYLSLANKYNLIATGGSDFHSFTPNCEVGIAEAVLDEKACQVLGVKYE